jgi:hypothetical protein
VALLALVGGAFLAAVAQDLLSDAPRLARWLTRGAVRLLPRHERDFFGWEAEIARAATDASEGVRSNTSVLLLPAGFALTAIRRRARFRSRLPVPTRHLPAGYVKIWLPPLADLDLGGYTVWAKSVGGDLFEVDNHPVFSDAACCGDIVRCGKVIETYDASDGTTDSYLRLEFREVVSEAARPEFHVFRPSRLPCVAQDVGDWARDAWASVTNLLLRHRTTSSITRAILDAKRAARRVRYVRRYRLWRRLQKLGSSLSFGDVDYFRGWLPEGATERESALRDLRRLGFEVEAVVRSSDHRT